MNMLLVHSGPPQDNESGFLDDTFTDNEDIQANHARADMGGSSSPPQKLSKQKTRAKSTEAKARKWSTPMELFYGVKPYYCVLYCFGSLGYFCCTIKSSGKGKSKFSSKSHIRIALGRSDYTNRMMFWDPTTSSFSISANFRLDPNRGLGDPFPGIHYDGAISPSVISGNTPPREPFPPRVPCICNGGR
jgi:hypothetical protein